MLKHVEVVPHNPAWHEQFELEAQRIRKAVHKPHLPIHHIGSTSIPGIHAKPIVDMLVEVPNMRHVDDELNGGMIRLGYFPAGSFGIPGRKLFIKGDDDRRTHHVHVYEMGHPAIAQLINFRDYTTAHPEIAREYDCLKQQLAHQFGDDVAGYYKGKTAFLEDISRRAAIWKATQTSHLTENTEP